MEPLRIKYSFQFRDGRKIDYEIALERESFRLLEPPAPNDPPSWTALDVEKCPNCPLSSETTPQCPVALRLSSLIDVFKNESSHEEVGVRVDTEERTYLKQCKTQEALFSLFGLIMATSGCPVMNYLRPMARFHLPFSSIEESIIRSVSMHLFRQYFIKKNGGDPDYELKELDQKYEEIQKVNLGVSRRLQHMVSRADATQNTVTAFHSISKMLSISINKNLMNYQYLFTDDKSQT